MSSQVTIVEELEPVRMHPASFIGSIGSEGLAHMLFELVGNSVDQHLLGKASRVAIDIDRSGLVTIEDDGPGIPVDVIGNPARAFIEWAFTTLSFTATLDGYHPHLHSRCGLVGVGAGAVSALSSRMEIETRRAGRRWRIAFQRGRTVEQLTDLGPTTEQGTLIRYRPDDQIFESEVRHDLAAIRSRLVQLAGLTPGFDLRFQGESLQRPEGLAGWLRELAPDAVTETLLVARGSHEGVIVDAAFAWDPPTHEKKRQVLSFVNCTETRQNGSHVNGLLAAVRAALPTEVDRERVMEGLGAIVHVLMLGPRFTGLTKVELDDEAAQLAVQEAVSRAINQAPWWWDRLHTAIG